MIARLLCCLVIAGLLAAGAAGQEPPVPHYQLFSESEGDWTNTAAPPLEPFPEPGPSTSPFVFPTPATEILERGAEQLGGSIKSIIDPWEGSIELGLNGVSGNADMFNLWWGGLARHRGPRMTETGWGLWILNHARNGQPVNTLLKDGRLDAPLGVGPWNWFLHGFFEYDETRAFDDRISVDTGLGYSLLDAPDALIVARSGLAGSQEFGGLADGFHPELYFGGALEKRFDAIGKVTLVVDYYPDVVRFSDYRLNTSASWQMLLVQDWNLHLKLSVIDRYDSTPHSPHPNDLAYSTLLLWAF